MYRRAGFERLGRSCPDLLLRLMTDGPDAGERLRAILAATAAAGGERRAPAPSRLIAVGWATVELDRAAGELAGALGIAAVVVRPPRPDRRPSARTCRSRRRRWTAARPLVAPRADRPRAGWRPRSPATARDRSRSGYAAAASGRRRRRRRRRRSSRPSPGPFGPERARPGARRRRGPYRFIVGARDGYHPSMTDQATIALRLADARRRRGDRRAVHRRGLPGRPERHRRPPRAVRLGARRG